MSTITVQAHQMLERILSLEIVRVTERAAVSAARLRGRGNEKQADQAAVDAMRRELNKLPIHGTVDRQLVEFAPHGVDRRLVCLLFVAATAQARSRYRGTLGHAHDLEREN